MNHMIISISSGEKTQYPFMIKKKLNKLGIEVNFLSLIKDIYRKPNLTSCLIVEDEMPSI